MTYLVLRYKLIGLTWSQRVQRHSTSSLPAMTAATKPTLPRRAASTSSIGRDPRPACAKELFAMKLVEGKLSAGALGNIITKLHGAGGSSAVTTLTSWLRTQQKASFSIRSGGFTQVVGNRQLNAIANQIENGYKKAYQS